MEQIDELTEDNGGLYNALNDPRQSTVGGKSNANSLKLSTKNHNTTCKNLKFNGFYTLYLKHTPFHCHTPNQSCSK